MKKEEQYIQTIKSPVGLISVHGNSTLISAIRFRNDPEVEVTPDASPLVKECVRQLAAYFEGRLRSFDFPHLQMGTTFQQSVWELLSGIPFGNTVNYQQLSVLFGDVKAIRAVAAANSRNNMAIVVPCHRVTGSNYSLTGYSGGLWRKKWLLEHEAKVAHGMKALC